MREIKSLEAVAFTRYVRISPYKIRRVVDQIRNRPVSEALVILTFLSLHPCNVLLKTLNSVISNGKIIFNNNDISRFYIKEIRVDQGPTLKRFRAHAQGRGFPIKKRMSHITSQFWTY